MIFQTPLLPWTVGNLVVNAYPFAANRIRKGGSVQKSGDTMTELTADTVLSVTTDGMSEFIQRQAASRKLSRMVKTLNRDLIEGDETARDRAAAALRHLGFCD
mgnify:FL=1